MSEDRKDGLTAESTDEEVRAEDAQLQDAQGGGGNHGDDAEMRGREALGGDAPGDGGKPAGGGTKVRFGLGGRLGLSFAAVIVMMVGMAGVAFISYDRLAGALDRVITTDVPRIETALGLSTDAAEVAAAAPMLLAASDQKVREERFNALQQLLGELDQRIERITQDASGEAEAVDGIRVAYEGLSANLAELNSLVERRLQEREQQKQQAAELLEINETLAKTLKPIALKIRFDFVASSKEMMGKRIRELADGLGEGYRKALPLLALQATINAVATSVQYETPGPSTALALAGLITEGAQSVGDDLVEFGLKDGVDRLIDDLNGLVSGSTDSADVSYNASTLVGSCRRRRPQVACRG